MAIVPQDATDDDDISEKLDEDYDTPFSEPDDLDEKVDLDIENADDSNELDDTHPATDSATNRDSTEEYNEGLAGASEAWEPNAGDTVEAVLPEEDDEAGLDSEEESMDDDDDSDADEPIDNAA
jgi:hypothetical protein